MSLKKRTLILLFSILLTVVLIIPSIIALPYLDKAEAGKSPQVTTKAGISKNEPSVDPTATIPVSVYRSETKTVDDLTLHNYLVGVVAGEMPANFNMEALKAQAIAARTYTVDRLLGNSSVQGLPDQAEMVDTTTDQVYQDPEQLKKIWGTDYKSNIKRIEQAVTDTEGLIITYKGEIIKTPSFFSTSNGYTEDASDYWEESVPYLQSVPSQWDLKSPKYKATITLTVQQVEQGLGVTLPDGNGPIGQVQSWTAGKRVAQITIGGTTFTGREVREKLNLPSTDFKMLRTNDSVQITTYGYGHGVGMSQYGANAMAGEGKTCKQILEYYYTGTQVSSLASLMSQIKQKL